MRCGSARSYESLPPAVGRQDEREGAWFECGVLGRSTLGLCGEVLDRPRCVGTGVVTSKQHAAPLQHTPGEGYPNRVVTTGRQCRGWERQARQRRRRERRARGAWGWPQAAQEGWRRGTPRRGPLPQLRGRAPMSTARRRQRGP